MFEISKTSKFIINKKLLTPNQLSTLKNRKIMTFDPSNTRKIPAKLIMPRGIGRHFCGLNQVNCYSSSYVEIYDNFNNSSIGILLNLWLFFNSSVAWLFRELLGRKNLGGGMLKAESIDLSDLSVYFDYQKLPQIKKIFERLSIRKALPTTEEIFTNEHREIDDIVFNSLLYDENEQSMIKDELIKTIKARETRSLT